MFQDGLGRVIHGHGRAPWRDRIHLTINSVLEMYVSPQPQVFILPFFNYYFQYET